MGWVEYGSLVSIIDHYGSMAQIGEVVEGRQPKEQRDSSYPQWWVSQDALSSSNPIEPSPNPDPGPGPGNEPTNAEIGRVVRYLFERKD